MPLIDVRTDESMSLDSFCTWVEAQDPNLLNDIEKWPELWQRLYALHNTPNLVSDYLKDELGRGFELFQDGNRYSGQSLILARRRGFYLRVNFWPSVSDPLAFQSQEYFDKFYVYGDRFAHDHNFDFLTIGLHGPGYQTDLWTYDAANVKGCIGEKVQLAAHGRMRLAPGTMLLFRKALDIHTQLAPEALSVSLNFIPLVPPITEQYLFDVHNGCIASIEHMFPRFRNMEVLVSELGDDDVVKAFQRIRDVSGTNRRAEEALGASQSESSGEVAA